MVLFNDNFDAFSDILQHCGEVVGDLAVCHVNRRHIWIIATPTRL